MCVEEQFERVSVKTNNSLSSVLTVVMGALLMAILAWFLEHRSC